MGGSELQIKLFLDRRFLRVNPGIEFPVPVAGGFIRLGQNELVATQNEGEVPDTGVGKQPEECLEVVHNSDRVNYFDEGRENRSKRYLVLIILRI